MPIHGRRGGAAWSTRFRLGRRGLLSALCAGATLYVLVGLLGLLPGQGASAAALRDRMASAGPRVVIVTTTRYDAPLDPATNVRWALAVRTAEAARAAGHPLIVVDGSPAPDIAAEVVRVLGTELGATVVPQVAAAGGGGGGGGDTTKGGALRQALAEAGRRFGAQRPLIAFQEPEKWSMVGHWAAVAAAVAAAGRTAGVIVVPQRTATAWATYPLEQQHSEQFGNAYVANLLRDAPWAAAADAHGRGGGGGGGWDWFFGPFAVSSDLLPFFAGYDGAWWDAQIVPLLRAWRAGAAAPPLSVPVDFVCDPRQRAEEEGSVAYCRKRLHQLQYLFPLLAAAIE